MNERYAKSEAGRAEIRARALPLARPARNLLLILDASKDAADWLAAVQGATPADLEALLSQGLIEPLAQPAVQAPAKPARAHHESREALVRSLEALPYPALYDLLTGQAKARLGLLKGYRLVLEIERCTDLPALQSVAARFVEQLAKEQGETGLSSLRTAVGTPG